MMLVRGLENVVIDEEVFPEEVELVLHVGKEPADLGSELIIEAKHPEIAQ